MNIGPFPIVAWSALALATLAVENQPVPASSPVPLPPVPIAAGKELLDGASFELPRVRGGGTLATGADPAKVSFLGPWSRAYDGMTAAAGKPETGVIVMGLSDSMARTGRQSLRLDFRNVTARQATAGLVGDFVAVRGGTPYRFAIWGRIDADNPITKDQRIPYMKLQVEWMNADRALVAPTDFRIQPVPGSLNRKSLFNSSDWSEYSATIPAPESATLVRMSWSWEVPPDAGATRGIAYFDDASILGAAVEAGEDELLTEARRQMEAELAKQQAAAGLTTTPGVPTGAPKLEPVGGGTPLVPIQPRP